MLYPVKFIYYDIQNEQKQEKPTLTYLVGDNG